MTSAVATVNDLRRVRVGVALPHGAGVGTLRPRLDAFCAALSGAIDAVCVTAHGISHYRELLEAVHAGDVDIAWLPPVVALRATARGQTIPIALPLRGGAASFSAALFARPDSPLRTPRDLGGARAAWVDRQSAAGYLVTRAGLRSKGIDLAHAFGEDLFLGSHEAVVDAVTSGEADVGSTYAQVDGATGNVVSGGWGEAEVHVIDHAGPIPSDVIAASRWMPAPLIAAVQRALCDANLDELRATAKALLGADGFIEARPEHLQPLNQLLEYLDEVVITPRAVAK